MKNNKIIFLTKIDLKKYVYSICKNDFNAVITKSNDGFILDLNVAKFCVEIL